MKVIKTVSKTENEEVTQEFKVFAPKTYDILKWTVMVVLPAISTLYLGLATLWGLPAAEKVVGTITLLTTFLGVLIGISANRYKNSDAPHDGRLVVHEDPGGVSGFMLELDGDPELLKDKDAISFRVQKPAA